MKYRSLSLGIVALLCQALPSLAAEDGKAIAEAGTICGAHACSACHGVSGEGRPTAGYPRLAGLGHDYIVRQLQNFADGARARDPMGPIAKALTSDQRDAVAAYYAGLPHVAADPQINRETDAAKILANVGDWSRGLPACSQCHGSDGLGVGTSFPPLAGQTPDYIGRQLKAWKAGDRTGDPLNLMTGIASKLNDADITAISDYYASLPARDSKGASQ